MGGGKRILVAPISGPCEPPPNVYRAYRRFRHCDDGGIAEGWSDRIAQLLSTGWPTVSEAARITSRDEGFLKFVLHHIDELMSPDQANRIMANAQEQCPKDARRFCGEVVKQIEHVFASIRREQR